MENLTPREVLNFSVQIRMNVSEASRIARVDAVLRDLDLMDISDIIIGQASRRGLSEAGRKRLALGAELVTEPSVIMLEEPTANLTLNESGALIAQLNAISKENVNVICTFDTNTPYELVKNLDMLMLMTEGKVIYHGPTSRYLDEFKDLEYETSDLSNPLWCLMEHFNPEKIIKERLLQAAAENLSSSVGGQKKFLDSYGYSREISRRPTLTRQGSSKLLTNKDFILSQMEATEKEKEKGNEEARDKGLSLSDGIQGSARKSVSSGNARSTNNLTNMPHTVEEFSEEELAASDEVKRRVDPLVRWYNHRLAEEQSDENERLIEEASDISGVVKMISARFEKYSSIVVNLATLYEDSWLRKTRCLLVRMFIHYIRSNADVKLKTLQSLFIAFIILVTFFNLGNGRSGIQNRNGLAFFLTTSITIMAIQGSIATWAHEKQILVRERINRFYSVMSYIISKSLCDFVFQFLYPFLTVSIIYYLVGLNSLNYAKFAKAVLTCQSLYFAGTAFGQLLCAFVQSIKTVRVFAMHYLTAALAMAGFFYHQDNPHPVISALSYISIVKFGYQALLLNEYQGLSPLSCVYDEVPCDPLKEHSFEGSKNQAIFVLFGTGFILRVVAAFGMVRIARPKTFLLKA
jgi:ABC-type multidrug transport system ATPase subunit